MADTFKCATCGKVKPATLRCFTGYGIDRKGRKHCVACCGVRDRADMVKTGRATLYLGCDPDASSSGRATVSNWPSTLRFYGHFNKGRHNIAGTRYDVWFNGPDGFQWWGVQYGDNTELCHCKRTKRKVA